MTAKEKRLRFRVDWLWHYYEWELAVAINNNQHHGEAGKRWKSSFAIAREYACLLGIAMRELRNLQLHPQIFVGLEVMQARVAVRKALERLCPVGKWTLTRQFPRVTEDTGPFAIFSSPESVEKLRRKVIEDAISHEVNDVRYAPKKEEKP